jgi:hypothetical protein
MACSHSLSSSSTPRSAREVHSRCYVSHGSIELERKVTDGCRLDKMRVYCKPLERLRFIGLHTCAFEKGAHTCDHGPVKYYWSMHATLTLCGHANVLNAQSGFGQKIKIFICTCTYPRTNNILRTGSPVQILSAQDRRQILMSSQTMYQY